MANLDSIIYKAICVFVYMQGRINSVAPAGVERKIGKVAGMTPWTAKLVHRAIKRFNSNECEKGLYPTFGQRVYTVLSLLNLFNI